MTTSRDPENGLAKGAESASSSGTRKGYRTPFSRRLQLLLPGRRIRGQKGALGGSPTRSATRARSKPARRRGQAGASKPAKAARSAPCRARDAATPTGARELGERPRVPGEETKRRLAAGSARRAPGRGARAGPRSPRGPGRDSAATAVAAAITDFGERCSKIIRGAVAPLLPPLLGLAALGRRGLAWLAAALTPLRAALIVTARQPSRSGFAFVDYRGVAVGVPDYAAYADAEAVAPAPRSIANPPARPTPICWSRSLRSRSSCSSRRAGTLATRPVVSLLGVLAMAVTLIVDVPAGLDESAQAIAYSGVEAQLVEGFWVQLFSGIVLVFGGLLVSHYARKSGKRASAAAQHGGPARRARMSPERTPEPTSARARPKPKRRREAAPAGADSRRRDPVAVACLASALVLGFSELSTTFELTPPGGEASR